MVRSSFVHWVSHLDGLREWVQELQCYHGHTELVGRCCIWPITGNASRWTSTGKSPALLSWDAILPESAGGALLSAEQHEMPQSRWSIVKEVVLPVLLAVIGVSISIAALVIAICKMKRGRGSWVLVRADLHLSRCWAQLLTVDWVSCGCHLHWELMIYKALAPADSSCLLDALEVKLLELETGSEVLG